MTRNFEALGLVLIAAAAISVIAASIASASFPLFHSEAEDTDLDRLAAGRWQTPPS